MSGVAASRRKVTPSPCPLLPVPEKPVIDPVAVANAGVNAGLPNGEPLTLTLVGDTVTTPLSALSPPCHAPMTGVTVYRQFPAGVSSSRHVIAATVPVQVPTGLTVAAPPPAGYRLTR